MRGGGFVEAGVIEGCVDTGESEGGVVTESDGLVNDGDVDGDRGGPECKEGMLYGAHTAGGGEGVRRSGEGGEYDTWRSGD